MNFLKRLEGVFFSPRPTFEALAAKPKWIDALAVILIALIAFTFLVTPYMQKDQLALMKDNTVLKERMGAERYDQMIQRMENPTPASRVVQTFLTTPLFYLAALLLQALILLILGRFFSSQGNYVMVLSALLHANLIDKLFGNAVRLVLALTRKSVMQTSTNLTILFPQMEVTSTSFVLLAQVDFFQLWLFGVLAFGLAAAFKIELKKALVLSYGLWFLKALVNVGIAMIGMGFLR